MFYKTFICIYVSEAKPLCFSLCSQMFDDVEHTAFKMFVMQMSNYLFVISFQQEALWATYLTRALAALILGIKVGTLLPQP